MSRTFSWCEGRGCGECVVCESNRTPARRTRVFVYGTLMRGGSNHRLLAVDGARFVGDARTTDGFTMRAGPGYPAVERSRPGDGRVVLGEVYEVDAATLATLDSLEGHPRYYRRETVLLDDGTAAATYLMSRPAWAVVESGSWREEERRREHTHSQYDAMQLALEDATWLDDGLEDKLW